MARLRRGKKSKGRSKGLERNDDRRQEKKDLSETCERGDARSSLNDISWYSRNPNLLVAAGSFPFPYRPGMSFPLIGKEGFTGQQPTVPGILRIDWVPSFGNSSTSQDPASIAGKEFYGRVRAAFTGAVDADAPDYMVYLGALDGVFTYIGWLKRLYRTLTTYSIDNLLLPDQLMAAYGMGAAAQELREQKMFLWQGINELILKSRKYKCPAVMDLFNRHYWMSDNVYVDAPSPRGQLYVFNLIGVYKTQQVEEAVTKEPVQGLVMTHLPLAKASGKTWVQTLIDFGDSLMEALDTWDDGYVISGYLMKAFQDTPSFSVAELLQNELITAQFVPEVLTQIENLRTISPAGAGIGYLTQTLMNQMIVTQNVATNAVVSNVNLTGVSASAAEAAILKVAPEKVNPAINLRSDNPTVADTVIASRLHAYAGVKPASTGTNSFDLNIIAGTEIPVQMLLIMTTASGGGLMSQVDPIGAWDLPGSTAGSTVSSFGPGILPIEQFDWHPFLYVFANPVGPTTPVHVLGDMYNMCVIQPHDLENLHKICFYSEFNSFQI